MEANDLTFTFRWTVKKQDMHTGEPVIRDWTLEELAVAFYRWGQADAHRVEFQGSGLTVGGVGLDWVRSRVMERQLRAAPAELPRPADQMDPAWPGVKL